MNQIIGGTTIRLHQDDNVVVAAQNIATGATIPGEGVVTASSVPSGHKIATRAIPAGDYVRKYNQIIGVATADIAPGAHVHVQNCAMSEFERDYAFCADMRPTEYFTGQDRATFQGIVREDGRIATRNFIGVMTTVNCSATVIRRAAHHPRRSALLLRPCDYHSPDAARCVLPAAAPDGRTDRLDPPTARP